VAAKGVFSSVAEVKVQEGESIESALRRFKRKVQQEDIIKDIKKHSFYLKPGDRRRAKQALARKRTRKKQRREVEYERGRRDRSTTRWSDGFAARGH
jgi:small subunit ribosomal protein S21